MTETEKIKGLIDTIIKDTESINYKVGIEADYLSIKKQGVELLVSITADGVSYDVKGENLQNLIATSQMCQVDRHKEELKQFYQMIDRSQLVPDVSVGELYKVSNPEGWKDCSIIKIVKVDVEKDRIYYSKIYKTERGMWNEGTFSHKKPINEVKQALLDKEIVKTSI